MNRRNFLQKSSLAALALPFSEFPARALEMRMGIIVHSYAHRWNSSVESRTYPGFEDAVELMEHCHQIGAGGIQVMVRGWSSAFAKKVRDRREALGLYLEGSVALPKDEGDCSRFGQEVASAREAGASVIRTVCLSGRRYENFDSAEAFAAFKKSSIASLQLAEPIVRKQKMKLAVENHKDWRATEMVDILKRIDSPWVGVNLDFGNNIALMEDPMEVAQALAPWLMTTHVKDMGVKEYADGFLLSEVPLGKGFLDLGKMFEVCRKHLPAVAFNLEMITRDPLKVPCLTDAYWTTFSDTPPRELAGTLRMVRQHGYKTDLPTVSQLSPEQRLAAEENNILQCLQYSKSGLGMD